jgi:hypothetical protein
VKKVQCRSHHIQAFHHYRLGEVAADGVVLVGEVHFPVVAVVVVVVLLDNA